ncbi:MAG: xanthine dehydrogenase family protein molybdopterin-binding subunit [Gammaproteobacteria bacterium]
MQSLDTGKARKAPGVLAILTGAELEQTGNNPRLPCAIPLDNRDGTPRADPKRPALAIDKVRYVGDPLAFVVAESLAAAKDAAELIEFEFEDLPAVADTAAADTAGQPLVHDDVSHNLVFDWGFGDAKAVEAAFAKAAHITKLELVNNKVIVNSMETRGVIADYDAKAGKLTVHSGTQGGWIMKDFLANGVLKTTPDNVRLLTPADVGGGFGMKAMIYPELVLAVLASRQLQRPVKWVGERSDAFISDNMGRDHVTTAELAFDRDHKIVGMRVETTANMGAYLSLFAPFIPTMAAIKVLPGVYDVKTLHYRVKGVLTHTVPVDAYRGAGRPESIYVMERLIEKAARELKVDRAELRRRNFIPPAAMPFKTTAGEVYDTGEFAKVMDKALQQADWAGIGKRQREARQHGKRRGIGMCYYIESTMGDPMEHATVRFTADGAVEVLVGTQNNGQGHETAYAQILHEKLGVPFDKVRVVQGDTDAIKSGGGTGGSRSVTAEGWAISDASAKVIERGKHYAAQELETAVADIEFGGGQFRVAGTDRGIGIMGLALKAKQMQQQPKGYEGGLDAAASVEVKAWTFPNGCHIAEVEIDDDTGVVSVANYSVVDDFGRLINPMLVEGQVHGGVVQGIGQALMEHAVYDDNGQLLTGSFMDYCMPRADNMPAITFSNVEVLCKNNPMGMKGCGEAGSVGSCGAVINAIIDALADLGVDRIDMPATPLKVWQTIQARKGQKAA